MQGFAVAVEIYLRLGSQKNHKNINSEVARESNRQNR